MGKVEFTCQVSGVKRKSPIRVEQLELFVDSFWVLPDKSKELTIEMSGSGQDKVPETDVVGVEGPGVDVF